MLFIYLHSLSPGQPLVAGPAPWFRISNSVLSLGPDGEAFAINRDHIWYVNSTAYFSIECREKTIVRFEDATGSTQDYGPFAYVRFVQAMLYANDKRFATLSPRKHLWRFHADESFWPSVVVKAVQRRALRVVGRAATVK